MQQISLLEKYKPMVHHIGYSWLLGFSPMLLRLLQAKLIRSSFEALMVHEGNFGLLHQQIAKEYSKQIIYKCSVQAKEFYSTYNSPIHTAVGAELQDVI